MRPPLRIAVLETDTPVEKVDQKYGGYGGVFEALLKASATALDHQPDRLDPERDLQISRWDVVTKEEYPDLNDVDAILMTGSSMFLPSSFSPSSFSFSFGRGDDSQYGAKLD
jgi:hypothetical protein